MPTRTIPDLFSAPPTVKAPESQVVPQGKAEQDNLASQPRHFLPRDLAGALKRLDDSEIDALLAAVTTEAERRGRLPPSPAKEKPAADAKPLTRQAPTDEDRAGSLTTGKLNAQCAPPSRRASSLPRSRGNSGFHSPMSGRRSPLSGRAEKPGTDAEAGQAVVITRQS
jgi:hypothetical protein